MRHGVSGRLVVAWASTASADERLARLAEAVTGAVSGNARIVRACRACGSDRHGKPYVVGLDGPIHVNLSRSGGIAVLAVCDAGPVGIDVEALHPGGTPDVATWVRKECVVKATGHGLTIDPDLVEVTPPGSAPALVAWPETEPLDSPVWMYDVECPAGYVAAAAVLSNAAPELLMTPASPEG
ncbi:4'-phosphopantetheinyl transferase family protein [Aeromicrobium ginsengisoli]|uniref:Uncharacterized protein n=1 Tax=Aeromicrobium ginsengisoli TaxID=363867 RepID=A0A5M4FDE1_9ACTN|nr:hypothetical protein [Aeromicrobium ginsengisoli]KAA1397238.1 hypothetical protein ESP70_007515 [Aeromicrobium ginsengisoli]